MSNHEERLDRYIDNLNAGQTTASCDDDAELAGLFDTVRQLHTLRESDVPVVLATGLAGQLRQADTPVPRYSHPERSAAESNGSFPQSARPWKGPFVDAQDDEWDTRPPAKHWLRQMAQFVGAALAFTVFGLVLVLVFQGMSGNGSDEPLGTGTPPIAQLAFSANSEHPDPDLVGLPEIYLVNADGSEPTVINPNLISLDEAIEIVRTFIGDPGANLEGAREDGLHGLEEYVITHDIDAAEYADQYIVDAVTGEIIEATISMNTSLHASIQTVTEDEAQLIAEEFVRARVSHFDSLIPSESQTSVIGPGIDGDEVVHVAEWRQQDSNSGAWLPTWITVEVDLDTGLVYSFVIRVEDYDGPIEPQVSHEQAIEAALAAAEELGMTELSVGDVELRVSLYETGEPASVMVSNANTGSSGEFRSTTSGTALRATQTFKWMRLPARSIRSSRRPSASSRQRPLNCPEAVLDRRVSR